MSQPKTYIKTPSGTVDASEVTAPATKEFRNSWDLKSPTVIEVDMAKARPIHRDAIRIERKGRFVPLDKTITPLARRVSRGNALTPQEETSFDEAEAMARKLRKAPNDIRITNANTPEELSALTIDVLTA